MGRGLSGSAEDALGEVLEAFSLTGTPTRHGTGHINDTFLLPPPPGERERGPVILQRLSAAAFPHPEQVMENVAGITGYLRERIAAEGGDTQRETLSLLLTRSGMYCHTDSRGGTWRCLPFIRDTFCVERAESPEMLRSAGETFGRFQRRLGDYPAHTLHVTIPRFHDTEHRLTLLQRAAERDAMGRAKECADELHFALSREEDCAVLRKAHLPLRVTHNDTKLSNLLFDRASRRGLCVIDLDTTMPGLSVHDFGDAIRAGARSEEGLDLTLYEAYTRGFLSETAHFLTEAESAFLPWGARLMTLECGIRFLTDYLEGDVYFRTHAPGQNLERCRDQFRLAADMERQFGTMEEISRCIFRSYK